MAYGHRVQEDVAELHRALDIALEQAPGLRRVDERSAVIARATQRTIQAAGEGDLVEAVRSLCDLLSATYGAACEWGVDLAPVWKEVHRSTMGRATIGGEGWTPADIAGVLRKQLAAAPPGNFDSMVGRGATAALGG